MPFDSAPSQAYPYSLEGFIAWLETKDPRETYCYTSVKNCAHAQFCHACGLEYRRSSDIYDPGIEKLALQTESRTFGKLLKNARKKQFRLTHRSLWQKLAALFQ